MGTFAYIARDVDGRRVTGKLAAATETAVLAELQSRQLSPVKIDEERETAVMKRRVSMRQLAGAYRQLADLLRAGVPLLRSLRIIGRSKSNPRLGEVINVVADAVSDGERLADAMTAHKDTFPDVQVAMVRAGEQGGFLEEVLRRMSAFLDQQADMRGKVVGNLIYPALLVLLGAGIIIYALIVFVPKFENFYGRIEVPWPTQVLIFGSGLLRNHWVATILVIGGLVAFLWWLRGLRSVRLALLKFQMRIPKWGPLARSLAVARFCRVFGTLLENGIPVLTAMQISRDSSGNILLEEAIDRAVESVRAGETLTQPLGASGLFSEDVLEMISIGESANNLPEVLITIADTLEKRVDRMLAVVMRLLEPILLMGLAVVVLFIFVALIVPIMQMSSAI